MDLFRNSQRAFPASKLYYMAVCLALFFVAAAASFNGYFDKWHFREAGTTGYMENNGLDDVANGTAERPVVYRQLLPKTANWLDRQVSAQTRSRMLAKSYGATFLAHYLSVTEAPLAHDPVFFIRYLIIYLMVFLFAWFSVCALYLVGCAAGYPPSAAAFGAVVFILLMPYFLTVGGYYYDYPELAFMGLAVWISLRARAWWIIPIAAVASLNKETFFAFVPTLYPLIRARYPRWVSGLVVGGGVAVSSAIYGFLALTYRHNPLRQWGGGIWDHVVSHFQLVLNLFRDSFRERTYGLPVNRLFFVLMCALIVATAVRGWRRLPPPFQRHGKVAALINLPLFIAFGTAGELRNLSFLYTTLFLLVAGNLAEWGASRPAVEASVPARS